MNEFLDTGFVIHIIVHIYRHIKIRFGTLYAEYLDVRSHQTLMNVGRHKASSFALYKI